MWDDATLEWLAGGCLGAAILPAVLGLRNCVLYRSLPGPVVSRPASVSVLIPARNEERRIQKAVESVLRCEGVHLEVLVWDDASTDSTARLVRELELADARVRLLGASSPPPAGWAGKQYGCSRLAEVARGDVLVFMDADVRLTRGDALARIAGAFEKGDLDFLSGVPLQKTRTWSECAIVPLIHFMLLGFLPFDAMRGSRRSAFAAGCGQLIACRASAYRSIGGHALVKASFHEGIALARAFRVAGSRTDLADFSALAVCRMYEGLRGVWNGFAKNAHEGLAAPASILPLSTLLLCGQVIPMIALLTGIGSGTTRLCLAAALGLGVGFRAVLALRFRQSWWGVLMHPFSVALLLANQWYGAFCRLVGRPVGWSGRTQVLAACAAIGSVALSSGGFAAEPEKDSPKQKCPALILEDQNGVQVEIQFPRKKPCLLVVAARRGTSAIPGWVQPVRTAFGDSVEILGVADVRTVPSPLRSTVRTMIKKESAWPVLMDWSGKTVSQFFTPGLDTEVLVLNRSGAIELRLDGAVSPEREARLLESLRACGARPPKPVPGP